MATTVSLRFLTRFIVPVDGLAGAAAQQRSAERRQHRDGIGRPDLVGKGQPAFRI